MKSDNPPTQSADGLQPYLFFIKDYFVFDDASLIRNYLTASFNVLPAVNFGTVIAGIIILALV